ncbi:MAG TPA: EAL domain-containing response regulator [Acetobacteraceae bacterium]|jgi:EAL domain-containing protein (putative c-di-GMP-specific phosphodiesterase class I)/CheY-like chemotaxis protein|nr:EAL domain-containing response regulator [Acetobacteraceae bacterium]
MQLIVLDDDQAIADYLASVAVACGWRVHAVLQEDAFQRLVAISPPDAIMLDLQLAGSDGVEQLQFLHANGYSGAIVLMSGFDARVLSSARQVGESLGLNIVAVLGKPTPARRVREVLAQIAEAPAASAPAAPETRPAAAVISADEVAHAIEAGRMELHLQPIVAAANRGVKRAEALIRWRDPARGLVGPDQFIPVAEQDSDVIDRLTMWVAETGVSHYQRLAALGAGIQICINISGRNLCSQDFPDRMAGVLERHAVPQGALGLEITESVAMHDLDATASVLTRLRLKGFPVAIDDFGTGHSSLTALRRMPFSAIKIDKSFVGELETSKDSLTIVRSVIQLARDMQLTSVAEGVGSADAARMLTELGIDGLQGYYFSEPLPFNGFASWLKDWPVGNAQLTERRPH